MLFRSSCSCHASDPPMFVFGSIDIVLVVDSVTELSAHAPHQYPPRAILQQHPPHVDIPLLDPLGEINRLERWTGPVPACCDLVVFLTFRLKRAGHHQRNTLQRSRACEGGRCLAHHCLLSVVSMSDDSLRRGSLHVSDAAEKRQRGAPREQGGRLRSARRARLVR